MAENMSSPDSQDKENKNKIAHNCIFPYFCLFIPIFLLLFSMLPAGQDPFPLLSCSDTTHRLLSLVLGFSDQERYGYTKESPTKDHKNDPGSGESLRGKPERAEPVQF